MPLPLNPNCDPTAWKRWRKLVEVHAVVTQFSKKKEDNRAATIVALLGLATLDLHELLPFTSEAEKADLTKTLGYFGRPFCQKYECYS